MAGCVCGEEISYNSSTGEGSGLFWCPPPSFFPIPRPTEAGEKGGGKIKRLRASPWVSPPLFFF